jgi:polyhydroxyalkanoate synthesis regulator phasin
MSDERETTNEGGSTEAPNDGASAGDQASDRGSTDGAGRSQRFGDGIKQGIGVLSAFKDALEETIQEARDRGDLSSDRAKEVMKEALDRAQTAADGARERLDFANQTELELLRKAVDDLSARVAALEGGGESVEPDIAAEESPEA